MPTTTVTLTFVSQPGNESGAWSGSPSLASALAAIGSNEALAFGAAAGSEATLNLQLQAPLPADAVNIRVRFVAWCRVTSIYAIVSMSLVANGVSRSAINEPLVEQRPVYFGAGGQNSYNLTLAQIVGGVAVQFVVTDSADIGLELYLDGIQAIIDYDVGGATPSPTASRLSLAASLGL